MNEGQQHPRPSPGDWPALPLQEWRATYATLHLMTQVVGKVRLACAPMVNHWWQVALRVGARGLVVPATPHGSRTFEMAFDFFDHVLRIEVSDGSERAIKLRPGSIAAFHREVMEALRSIGLPLRIWTRPVEIDDAVPFDRDHQPRAYDPALAHRCFQVLVQAARVLEEFRSGYVGKCSPVNFFWGGFDLALTRFSGRRAPEHPGGIPNLADRVVREAYSHECISCGFWPGGGPVQDPVFYAYAWPEPAGFRKRRILPEVAYYSEALGEFLLPWEVVRQAADPDRMVLDFLQSTYEAGAELGGWDRAALERQPPAPALVRREGSI